MAQFNPGDVVSLKSGGPSMTVEQVGPQGQKVVCVWIVEGKDVRSYAFAPDALERAKPGPGIVTG